MDFQSYTLINNSYAPKLSVQKVDSAIHRINHYPADKNLGNHWITIYPADSAIQVSNNLAQFDSDVSLFSDTGDLRNKTRILRVF